MDFVCWMETQVDPLTAQILLMSYYPIGSYIIRPSSSGHEKTISILRDRKEVVNVRLSTDKPEDELLRTAQDLLGDEHRVNRVELLHALPLYIHVNHSNDLLRRCKPSSFLVRAPTQSSQCGLVLCVSSSETKNQIHRFRLLHCYGNGKCKGWSLQSADPTTPKFQAIDDLIAYYQKVSVASTSGEVCCLKEPVNRTWVSKLLLQRRIKEIERHAMTINSVDYAYYELEFEVGVYLVLKLVIYPKPPCTVVNCFKSNQNAGNRYHFNFLQGSQ
ncbi:hypothetical protein ACOME3_001537 [Neoechinorhynchus agilis]